MSTKTGFKRIALALAVSLGFGVLSAAAPSQAAVTGETLTISSATATAYVGDTATASLTHTFAGTTASDSSTIRYTCTFSGTPVNTACPAIQFAQTATADTANVMIKKTTSGLHPEWTDISSAGWTDSATSTTQTARSVVSLKATPFNVIGTYTYSFYTQTGGVNPTNEVSGGSKVTGISTTWAVTVSALSNTGASVANVYVSSDNHTGVQNRLAHRTGSDSAIVAAAGNATTLAIVGYAWITVKNSAGDTRTLLSGSYQNANESVTVTITGAGLISNAAVPSVATGTTDFGVSKILNVQNGSALTSTETLTIASNGTAGTATLTFTNASNVVLATKTVSFTGTAAAAYPYFGLSATNGGDTIVSLSNAPTVSAVVKDSAGNVLKSGTLYLYSSDTKIIGNALSTSTAQKVTTNTCAPATAGVSTVFTCASAGLALNGETGTATLVIRDSWTVAASSWASAGIDVTVTDDKIKTLTVAFDKSTYAPGDRAVITITVKDPAGRAIANGTGTALSKIVPTPSLTGVNTAGISGTAGSSDYTNLALTLLGDSGTETRVVVMPSYGTAVSFEVTIPTFGSTTGGLDVVTAKATVVDPVQTAQNTAIANAQAAADAATDAALQAIDAANAATDAANLAAEAADAATVAAQESKDSADAATAAVESLATQVATLMAALQAQITSLANVVAKIAKKVKA